MRIERLEIKNYKAFRHVVIDNIPGVAVFIGANGVGKSTLFDVFDFLKDCLISDVNSAVNKRGGFSEVVSSGCTSLDSIEFKLTFAEPKLEYELVFYEEEIEGSNDGPFIMIEKEELKPNYYPNAVPFLLFQQGVGKVNAFYHEGEQNPLEKISLSENVNPWTLALKSVGYIKGLEEINKTTSFIESFCISDIQSQLMKHSEKSGLHDHLSKNGENLPRFALYIYKKNPELFNVILNKIIQYVPGLSTIKITETEEKRILLKFQDGSFKDPFSIQHVSDGTLKLFAYLLMLYDPKPAPLLCIEEPENQLYPSLLYRLSEEFESYALKGNQVFVTTHSPVLLDAIDLKSIYYLIKKDGFTEVFKAEDNPDIKRQIDAGDIPGYLWQQHGFEGLDPC